MTSDSQKAEIDQVDVVLVDACEGATCPCGHVALDHAWHGCENCTCNRSGIHAVLASGVVAAVGTTVTEWGALMAGETEPEDVCDSRELAEFVIQDQRDQIVKWEWDSDDYEPMTVVSRQRTTFPTRLTVWAPVAGGEGRG